jgi:TPR repeat protein
VSLQIVVNEFVHRIGLACAVIAILIIPACEGVKRTATRWDQDLQQFFGTAQPEPPPAQLTASPQPDQPAPSSQAALPQQANEPAAEPQPAAEPEPVPAAIASLREAAVGGDAEAQFALGEAYETGELVGPDLAWAARWYGRSAYGGYSEAQYRYARLKMEGRGLPRDREGAYRWLALAARQGHGEAERARAELELSLGIDRLYQGRQAARSAERGIFAGAVGPARLRSRSGGRHHGTAHGRGPGVLSDETGPGADGAPIRVSSRKPARRADARRVTGTPSPQKTATISSTR